MWIAVGLLVGVVCAGCSFDGVNFEFHDDSPEAMHSDRQGFKKGQVDFSREDCERWQRRFHNMLERDSN